MSAVINVHCSFLEGYAKISHVLLVCGETVNSYSIMFENGIYMFKKIKNNYYVRSIKIGYVLLTHWPHPTVTSMNTVESSKGTYPG